MRFMSFNTQHCRNYLTGEIDFDIMAKAILDCGADVIGLNEMRGEGPDAGYTAQMERLAALTGMHYVFAPAIYVPRKGPYGNAENAKTHAIPRYQHGKAGAPRHLGHGGERGDLDLLCDHPKPFQQQLHGCRL